MKSFYSVVLFGFNTPLVPSYYCQYGSLLVFFLRLSVSLFTANSLLGPQSRQSAKLFSSRKNWDSPNPSPGECAPPPLVPGGGAHSLAREGVGVGESHTVKRVDEVVPHRHLVTQDQTTQVSNKFFHIHVENFTINIELFRHFSQVFN
jgi:hypothetical protein